MLLRFEKREENEVIYRQGERGNKFYVIVAGAVLITKSTRDSVRARRLSGGVEGAVQDQEQEQGQDGASPAADGAATANGTAAAAAAAAASRRKKGLHHRQPTTLPGVILRRGNDFAEQCLISSRPHWSTATSLALSVLLTLTRENFDKYVKIAPELKELFLRRERVQQEEEEAEAREEAAEEAAEEAEALGQAASGAGAVAGEAAAGASSAPGSSPAPSKPGTPSSKNAASSSPSRPTSPWTPRPSST